MKIAYLNPFNDGTGYANAGIRTMLAMDAAGLDLYPRETKLASQVILAPDRIQELSRKEFSLEEKPDVVIQHILPPVFNYVAGAKNIGYFHVETTNFKASNWQYYANLMDEIWVSCHENRIAAEESGVKKPIKIVPIPADLSIYEQDFSNIDLFPIKDKFVFYTIADWSSRKNILSVIKAYLINFSQRDDVVLVLKSYIEGCNAEQSKELITREINDLKSSLRKGNDYPKIILITDYLSPEQIYALHQQSHCFVSAERGAAWNIPAFDALGFGNYIVVNGWGGQTQFCDGQGISRTRFHMIPVEGMIRCPYPNIYTCREQWAEADNIQLGEFMTNFYEDWISNNRSKPNFDRENMLNKFSLETIGNKIKCLIN